jgi:prophage regulatory protein
MPIESSLMKHQLLDKISTGRAFITLPAAAFFLGIAEADLERAAAGRKAPPPFQMPMVLGRRMVDVDSLRVWLRGLEGRDVSDQLPQPPATAVDSHVNPGSLPDRILRLREVCSRAGVARSTIYYWIQLGTFPKPVAIGGRAVGWRESVINEWLQSL